MQQKHKRSVLAVLLLSLITLTNTGCGSSQTGNVRGTLNGTVTRVLTGSVSGVLEEEPGSPIRVPASDTEVEIYQDNRLRGKTNTDSQGRFTFVLPIGRYTVKPSSAILERTPAIIGSQEVDIRNGQTHFVELEITIPSV